MFFKKKKDVLLDLLARMAQNVERSGVLLSRLVRGEDQPDEAMAALQGLQTSQRVFQRQLLRALAGAFVTPLEGQDIFNLALGMGRLTYEVAGVAGYLGLSGTWQADQKLVQLASCAEESLRETSRAIGCLVRRDREKVFAAAGRLHQVQDRADRLRFAGLYGIDALSGVGDAVWRKEVFTGLAGLVLSCAELVQTVGWVMVHNA